MRLTSKCEVPGTWTFHWYDGQEKTTADQVKLGVDACMNSILVGKQRRLSPWMVATTKSEFENVLLDAQSGRLEPEVQVKLVGPKKRIPLTELRWQGITVQEQLASTTSSSDEPSIVNAELEVRMYLTEPDEVPYHLIGHLAHEKIIVPNDRQATNQLQDKEMDKAADLHIQGASCLWDVA